MAKSIMLIPHGAGNIGSLMELFHQVGYFPHVAQSPSQLDHVDMAVLPGVGASGSAMARLRETGFADALVRMNERQRPLVGICVGAQVMFDKLHENDCTGLKLLPGEVARINGGEFNNGWADVRLEAQAPARPEAAGMARQKPLLLKTEAKTFYFNHGYQINTGATMQETGYTTQGKKLLAYFVRDNLCGIQFHPEKSQAAGLAFIANTMKHYGF
ncbi:MAG: imidazole glycerol phosphate synthase subunit HisH [Bdellovibrionales bacterium]|nr:imidazole glycerol phosphate synthase subunit HisH [Ramlibacter sp.]